MIDLPDTPGSATWTLSRVGFAVVRQSEIGGDGQQINHIGDRWAVEVTLNAMHPDQARDWHAALTMAAREGGRWRLRQLALSVSVGGGVLVAGAGQLGMTVNIDGCRAGGAWPRGALVNIVTGGNRYLHMLAAAGSADAAGIAALPLAEPLRTVPADNAQVDFAPRIEGRVAIDVAALTYERIRLGRVPPFTITELR